MEQIRKLETPADLWGVGIFSVSEASKLTGISPARLRRWLKGYTWTHDGNVHASNSLWRRQLPEFENSLALSFLDLIEARFVDAFRNAGVPWTEIRSAAARAAELLGVDHPFSSRRFMTDGRRIFTQILDQKGGAKLLELSKSQYAFEKVVSPSFCKNIDFDESALRWWWLGRKRSVVIDPARQFGTPIVAREGVPTRVLFEAYLAEDSVARVSALFTVEKSAVQDAIDFERRLAA